MSPASSTSSKTQIAPLFYAKPDGKLPLAWLQLMRESIRAVVPVFNTHRMVREYNERLYEPAARGHNILAAGGGKKAVELARWKDSMRKAWPQIRVASVATTNTGAVLVGESVEVKATVVLGPIAPEYVTVQAYYGKTVNNEIREPTTTALKLVKKDGAKAEQGTYEYSGTIPAAESGSYGLSVRVIPTHPNLIQAHELRLITWAK